MKIVSFLIGICFVSVVTGQDGSNIRYYNPDQLHDGLIGKFCHIDFGKESFGGRSIDTTEIDVKGQLMKFYEHRKDNGYNNWFNEQYLISVPKEKYSSVRLRSSKINKITKEKIYVTSILSYYHNDSPIDTITVFKHSYNRNNIAKVLVKD